ncbi:hypothetical protein [Luteimonas aquatica]|uniref:hypothetical protein n=1 Tax=Luteimonas aquatica TaxID=450364 RepID=UPI001F59C11E|nr:hypothetical protein [Luteimonas aquatica]
MTSHSRKPSAVDPPAANPLILSVYAHDIHAHAVRWGLRRNGYAPVWAHSLADEALTPASLEFDDQGGVAAFGALSPGAVSSVWFRRPRFPEHFPRTQESDLPFVRNEWKRFLLNAYAVADALAGTFWVNRPNAAVEAENKLVQMRAAQRCGLTFPRTLVSSDPAQIRRFVADNGQVVYKPFQTHTWQDAEGRMYSTYARTIDAAMLEDEDSLRQCPGIYQALVPKTHDVRVTVVGGRFLAARLEGGGDATFVDWRASSIGNRVSSSATTLPAALEAKISALMRELGIVFGCVDLAIDAEGRAHFLEVNQSGQFLFLEHSVPELPILQAVCAMLGQARADYAIEAIQGVSYADYLASDEHREWWDAVSGDIRQDGNIPGVSLE